MSARGKREPGDPALQSSALNALSRAAHRVQRRPENTKRWRHVAASQPLRTSRRVSCGLTHGRVLVTENPSNAGQCLDLSICFVWLSPDLRLLGPFGCRPDAWKRNSTLPARDAEGCPGVSEVECRSKLGRHSQATKERTTRSRPI